MSAARTEATAYPLLLALGALDATGYSVIVPVAPAVAEATGASAATMGLLVASFPAGMVAGFAGAAVHIPLWVLALVLAAVGIGLANTGSLGLLIEAVPIERIVTAMVVWSQIGIAGYLLGPLVGASS